ncbi:DEAD/DEAH box helicase [Nesterenkonia sphaerica]|uniref:DEAD/DEAH box helicase n=1 Tax=Nesterenkonia sphaerica TaxID=1804988 RepID=UPI001FB5CD6E|nr:DEAD/DEAH box helicase [Nesterenkonia sphaerica]
MAPGSVVTVRDEEWMVTAAEDTPQGTLVHVRGLSDLVRDTSATFYSGLDHITVVDPAHAQIIADSSPGFRLSKLFLETTLRKTPQPTSSGKLTVSTRSMADPLGYQQLAVARALDPAHLRPRILLADAVGLGKTFEIGMILSELAARGRAERILIVTPRHVLEQFQQEMWVHFALPFVRLDSAGIQKVRQKIPATRNPFTYYKRAIVSIDTLKSAQYRAHLERMRWDAVVIDESHNLTNSSTLNNRLASTLAPRTDALILASATPHNGNPSSFAELIRLLDPTAVSPEGEVDEEAVQRLIIRRHRYSPEVAAEVGDQWAERPEPRNLLVSPTPAEDAVASEIADTWLYPTSGISPSTSSNTLFGWTLVKAFLSSPAALAETLAERLKRLDPNRSPAADAEREALKYLQELTAEAQEAPGAKLTRLAEELKAIGVGPRSETRAVVFAERVATLHHLADELKGRLNLKEAAVRILHGGLSDVEQQQIVDEFKRGSSKVRLLITGDMASEGVNLHSECHHLFHYDVPWSLIRIEQRNGRIDRYGQLRPPQIATLLLQPNHERFRGDIRVFTNLIKKEHAAHKVLGDAASLMGKHSVAAEEKVVMTALQKGQDVDQIIPEPQAVSEDDDGAWGHYLALFDEANSPAEDTTAVDHASLAPRESLYGSDLEYLEEALRQAFDDPYTKLGWTNYSPQSAIAELTVTEDIRDLRRRLEHLPQDYVSERKVLQKLKLATTPVEGRRQLEHARREESITWPGAHFLGPLHPVLDWAADRALADMSRNQVLALRARVAAPTFLMMGTVTNRRGHLLSRAFMTATRLYVMPLESLGEWLEETGLTHRLTNPGHIDVAPLTADLPAAITKARDHLESSNEMHRAHAEQLLNNWLERASRWEQEADVLVSRQELKSRRARIAEEKHLAEDLRPAQNLVRPLLALVPEGAA